MKAYLYHAVRRRVFKEPLVKLTHCYDIDDCCDIVKAVDPLFPLIPLPSNVIHLKGGPIYRVPGSSDAAWENQENVHACAHQHFDNGLLCCCTACFGYAVGIPVIA